MAQARSTKIISRIKWIRTSRLSITNSLSGDRQLAELERKLSAALEREESARRDAGSSASTLDKQLGRLRRDTDAQMDALSAEIAEGCVPHLPVRSCFFFFITLFFYYDC